MLFVLGPTSKLGLGRWPRPSLAPPAAMECTKFRGAAREQGIVGHNLIQQCLLVRGAVSEIPELALQQSECGNRGGLGAQHAWTEVDRRVPRAFGERLLLL